MLPSAHQMGQKAGQSFPLHLNHVKNSSLDGRSQESFLVLQLLEFLHLILCTYEALQK